jgi:predicted nicotinamide N-methyase
MNLPVRTIPIQIPIGGSSSWKKELEIQQEGVGAGKTGLAVWNSGLLLGRLLEAIVETDPTWLQGRKIAEVGCGAGLVSLMCSHWGADSVWATDGNPVAVRLTGANFERNHVQYSTQVEAAGNVVAEMKWDQLEVPVEWMGKADLVVGSDLTYNSGAWRVLAETMESLLSPKGIVIYLSLGHSGFNVRGEMDGFVNVARELGLSVILFENNLPFSLPRGVSNLDALLQRLILPSEESIIAATGGAQVVVLTRK